MDEKINKLINYLIAIEDQKKPYIIWETKDLKEIPIYKMTDEHIKNAINSLEKHLDNMEMELECDPYGFLYDQKAEAERNIGLLINEQNRRARIAMLKKILED